ncbi:hypothetical protein AB0N93_13540 [Streptomyces sp. NPDC091267]|uniref:hypothetical protein n=1 Tax=Streptomyces sp. NPDC091267 TaxID=3155195 RepID=UPI003415A389
MHETGAAGGSPVPEGVYEPAETARYPESVGDADHSGSGVRRRLSCLAVVTALLVLVAGGFVWLFQDALFHPFGDSRACEGSDTELPGTISVAGVSIPADASDIHYFTRSGRAQVSFLSDEMPDYLHRAGLVPTGEPVIDENHGGKYALGDQESELPVGLCGPALKGPAAMYQTSEPSAGILIERSAFDPEGFRSPARVIASFTTS